MNETVLKNLVGPTIVYDRWEDWVTPQIWFKETLTELREYEIRLQSWIKTVKL